MDGERDRSGILVEAAVSSSTSILSSDFDTGLHGERARRGLCGLSLCPASFAEDGSGIFDGERDRSGVGGFDCSSFDELRVDFDGLRASVGIMVVLLDLTLACLTSDACVGVEALVR